MRKLIDFEKMRAKIKEILEGSFREKNTLGKIAGNFLWLLFDKFFRMGVGLFVSVLIIRHLGAEVFGKWNYVIAFQSFFSVFIVLGLDTIVIRELVVNRDKEREIFGSVLFLRLAGALFAFFAGAVTFHFWTGGSRDLMLIMLVISSGALFLIFDTIDLYYRSELKSKVSVLSKNMAFALVTLVRVHLLYTKADLIFFVIANAAELVLGALFLVYIYTYGRESIFKWRVDFTLVKNFLKESWTWTLALLLTTIFMKVDQIFVGDLLDKRSLGLYSASLKLYDIAYSFVSMAFFSLFPKIAALHERNRELFLKRSSDLIFYFTLVAFAGTVFMFFFGEKVCLLLYGEKYREAGEVVFFHFTALIFVFNGFFRSGFLTVNKKNSDLLWINLTTVVFILPVDYWAIKTFGLRGAAAMSVVLQAYAFYLSNLIFPSTRELFFLQTEAFVKILNPLFYAKVFARLR